MERLQKVLATAGYGSRRSCEEIILQGRVIVNNKVVRKLGLQVDLSKDKVICDGEQVKPEKKKAYVFNKPRGIICTHAKSESTRVIDFFKTISSRLFTVGRLDQDSEGLIIVTNDGEFSQTLSHPSFQFERVYRVKVKGTIPRETIQKMQGGVWLSIGKIKPKSIRCVLREKKFTTLEIVITEGKNREIRRIFAAMGFPVKMLQRVKFGPIALDNLELGCYRLLTDEEWELIPKGKKKNRNKAKNSQKNAGTTSEKRANPKRTSDRKSTAKPEQRTNKKKSFSSGSGKKTSSSNRSKSRPNTKPRTR